MARQFLKRCVPSGLALLFMAGSLATTSVQAAEVAAPVDPTPAHLVSPEATVRDPQMEAASPDSPLFVAVFGDSVTLGTMADAQFGNPGPRFYADFIGSLSVGTLNDFILKQMNRQLSEDEMHNTIMRLFGNMARKNLSPFLGTQDYSLPVLINETTGNTPKIYNGAQMAGAYYFGHLYLDKFTKFYQRNPFHKRPELVIVNFNGMDFMDNRSPEVYSTKVKEFYQRLTKMVPYATIVVTGIKDSIPLLTYPDRVAVPNSPVGPITCSALYKFVRFSNATGLYPEAPQAAIDLAYGRLAVLRGILEKEVGLINTDRIAYPHFKGRMVYVDPTTDDGITPEMIAADCIHPNQEGQKIIGESMWNVIEPLLP